MYARENFFITPSCFCFNQILINDLRWSGKGPKRKRSLILGSLSFRLWEKPNTLWCACDKTTIFEKKFKKMNFFLDKRDKGEYYWEEVGD
jgi:hypothetical protein